MREIKVNELKEGMTTAVDVFSPKGQLILKRHQAVSAFDIAKFGFYNIAWFMLREAQHRKKKNGIKNMPSLRKNIVIPSITCMNI